MVQARQRDQLAQIAVTGRSLGQQRQMGAISQRHFGAAERVQTGLARAGGKAHCPGQAIMVGERQAAQP